MLWFAALAESRSSHPIGTAVLNEAKEQGLSLNEQVDVVEVAGKGVKATLQGGRTILAGRPLFLEENGIDVDTLREGHAQTGGTIVSVAVDGKLAGLIVVADEPRPEAKEAIEILKALDVQVEMLTGRQRSCS
ncbi:HAD family hydrolase [Candidatus Bathyarchaeota archaeon]|nr:HAD family hydrolase [Candidatus Bathyarchaeota archaeon]MBS7631342.1 HAD family hydrolase [Candidatus Bathyarchaeota archaeon]